LIRNNGNELFHFLIQLYNVSSSLINVGDIFT
jgi:hypothetical protein